MNTPGSIRLMNPSGESFFSQTPKHVSLEITGHCQLSCHHCFNESGSNNENELPLRVIEEILDEIVSWELNSLRISGGEPTLHAQFREIITACEKRALNVSLNSHGVYGQVLLEWLCTAPIDYFFISLDGLKENNEAIRGKKTFAKTVASCKALLQAGQKVCISFHVGRSNQHDLAGLIELAAEIGADFKLSPIRPLGRAAHEMSGDLILPEQFLSMVQEVNHLRQHYSHIQLFTDFDILSKDKKPKDTTLSACKAGRTMMSISSNGEIYPCAFFATADRRFSAGNVYHDSIIDVWRQSPVFKPFRIQTRSEECQGCCHYQHSCAGGCPAVSYSSSGFIDALDPVCFAHIIADSSEEYS